MLMSKFKRGFTLVELIITIIIMSVLVTYFSVRMPGKEIEVYYQASQLSNFIRLAQQYAISRSDAFRVALRNDGYHIYYSANISNITSASDDMIYPSGINKCSCGNFGSNTCYILFDPAGIPYAANESGNFTPVTSDFDVTICADSGEARMVRINKAGGVTVP